MKYYAVLLLCVLCVAAYSPAGLDQTFVNDDANIINPAMEQTITAFLQNLQQNTSIEFAVVTTPDLDGSDAFDASLAAAEYLGVGDEDLDNGLLIFVAPNDREYFIQVGYGLEGAIPDIVAGRVGREVLRPAFIEEQYGQGIYDALQIFAAYATQDESAIQEYNYHEEEISRQTWLFILFIIILIIFILISRLGPFIWVPMGPGGFHGPRGGLGGFSGGRGFGGGGFGGGGAGGGW